MNDGVKRKIVIHSDLIYSNEQLWFSIVSIAVYDKTISKYIIHQIVKPITFVLYFYFFYYFL